MRRLQHTVFTGTLGEKCSAQRGEQRKTYKGGGHSKDQCEEGTQSIIRLIRESSYFPGFFCVLCNLALDFVVLHEGGGNLLPVVRDADGETTTFEPSKSNAMKKNLFIIGGV